MCKFTTEQFIEKSKLIHGNKYDYSKVVYKNSATKITIICPKHGEFQQVAGQHKNRGCKKCSKEEGAKKRALGIDVFLERAKKTHGSKYDYSLVNYKCQYDKVKIICPLHGVFEQTPRNHWSYGCNLCCYEDIKNNNEKERQKIIPLIKDFRKNHNAVETAKKFGVSQSFLTAYKIFDDKTQMRFDLPDKLSYEQEQLFIGNMLGDGSLKYIPENSKQNSNFVLGQKFGFREYVKGLYNLYMPFSCNYWESEAKAPSRVDGKISHDHWNGNYLKNSRFYTFSHPVFSQYRLKWYKFPFEKRSPKVIPKDLVLTWQIAAIWMCDDGSNHGNDVLKRRNHSPRYLMLHTESFTESDVEFLIHCLEKDLNIKSSINRHDGKPTIRVGNDYWFEFTEKIKPYIPWECFKYKCVNREKVNRNKSGYEGIRFYRGAWQAYKCFRKNGIFKQFHIGSFDSPEEAGIAREKWIRENLDIKNKLKF